MSAPPTSHVFQKTFTDLDLAMFCFPKSQPTEPYNCALVSLQLMRLLTPVKSNALIPRYHLVGVQPGEFIQYIYEMYGLKVEFRELGMTDFLAGFLTSRVFPGFACLVILSNEEMAHTVVYHVNNLGIPFLIDPQTGKIYSNVNTGNPAIKNLNDFVVRHSLKNVRIVVYKDLFLPIEDHLKISRNTDIKLGTLSIETFYKRGQIVESNVLTGGRKSRKTRRRLSRTTKLTR